MGRWIIGWLPTKLPLPSPMLAQTMVPPLMTRAGLAPKEAKGQSTMSAILPGAMLPT